jgi:hypothetical protein
MTFKAARLVGKRFVLLCALCFIACLLQAQRLPRSEFAWRQLNRLLDHSDIIVVGELSISWWRVPLLDG